MEFIETIQARIPDYARDIRLNLDATLARSSLEPHLAAGVALAAALAARSPFLVDTLRRSGALTPTQQTAAETAAALMGMNNVWYPYVEMAGDPELKSVPAQLRMNAYASHGGVDAAQFEMYALAASIVGKCTTCVASHYANLKKGGLELNQLRDIGRIAAVIQAAALIIATGPTAD